VREGNRLVEPCPAIPETNAEDGRSARSRRSSALSPPGRRRGPERQRGKETSPCSGKQTNPLLASLCPPGSLTQ